MIRDDPGERLVFHRSDALSGAELMVAYGSLQPWHVFHENYAFCTCRIAAAAWKYRRGTHLLQDGTTMLLEPGEVHRNTTVQKRSDFKTLFISPAAFEDAARELAVPVTPHFSAAQVEDPQVRAAIFALGASIEAGETPLRQQSLLIRCIHLLLGYTERNPERPGGGNEHRAVARARACIEDRCHEAITLDEIARATGLSRYRLVHAFAREVGLPPHAYQIHVRIERARISLRAGERPADVAAEFGFADQSHFIRHFKRIMRVTPGEYARAVPRR